MPRANKAMVDSLLRCIVTGNGTSKLDLGSCNGDRVACQGGRDQIHTYAFLSLMSRIRQPGARAEAPLTSTGQSMFVVRLSSS